MAGLEDEKLAKELGIGPYSGANAKSGVIDDND